MKKKRFIYSTKSIKSVEEIHDALLQGYCVFCFKEELKEDILFSSNIYKDLDDEYLYIYAQYVDDNDEKIKSYKKLIKRDYTLAFHALGLLYSKEQKTLKKAIILLNEAINRGCLLSLNTLMAINYKDAKTEDDYKNIFLTFKKIANQHYRVSERNVGVCYVNGTGVKKDRRLAIKWYKKAAAQFDNVANYFLGVSYLYGRGVRKSYATARYYFYRAATYGHLKAKDYILLLKNESVLEIEELSDYQVDYDLLKI